MNKKNLSNTELKMKSTCGYTKLQRCVSKCSHCNDLYTYTILTGWKIRHTVSIEGGRLEVQGQGAAGSRDPGSANGLQRWIQGVRIF